MPQFVIAYDISDRKRLARVARRLEQSALRVQKSVFMGEMSVGEVRSLLNDLQRLIDPDWDCVQAWRITEPQPAGMQRGAVIDPVPAGIVVDRHDSTLITRKR